MPVGIGIWRIDGDVRRLDPSLLPLEALLEDAIERDSSILGLDLLIVGRQVPTAFGKRVDLLGLDDDGALYVIELKRDDARRVEGSGTGERLERLAPGARIFAHIPGTGYVGVGTVEETARIVTEITIPRDGKMVRVARPAATSAQNA